MAATTEAVSEDQAKQAIQADAHQAAAAHTGLTWEQVAQYVSKFLDMGGDIAVAIGPFIPGYGATVSAAGVAANAIAKSIEEHTS